MPADVTPLRKVPAPAPEPEPLWREVLGSRLRELRRERQEKLTETAGRAGISPQYLSELERGRKEPSSEMIAALAGAFGLTLMELATLVAEDLRRQAPQQRLRLREVRGVAAPEDHLREVRGVAAPEDHLREVRGVVPPEDHLQGVRGVVPPEDHRGPVALLSMAA